jgi:uncharacterized membrane protein YbjE (DUF340 family)
LQQGKIKQKNLHYQAYHNIGLIVDFLFFNKIKMYNTMKKCILYILLFLATVQVKAQGVSFKYDASGNRIKRSPIVVQGEQKQAIQAQNTAPLGSSIR